MSASEGSRPASMPAAAICDETAGPKSAANRSSRPSPPQGGSAGTTSWPSSSSSSPVSVTAATQSGSTATSPSEGDQVIAMRRRPGSRAAASAYGWGGGGAQLASPGSVPARTSRSAAVSATVRVSTPSCTRNCSPISGACDTRPRCGLRPTRPQHAAGMRSEPPPSLPCANGTMPAATAAALPPDEPPGVRVGSHGFRVRSVTGRIPHSGIDVVPTTIAPAARSRRTTLWSCPARTSRMSEEPQVRRSPVTARLAFTATGTPASGRGSPAVTSAAAARAPAPSTSTNAPRSASSAAMRASASSTSSGDVTWPAPTSAASSVAGRVSRSWSVTRGTLRGQ